MNISKVIFAKTFEKYLFHDINFVIVWIKNIKYREWKKKKIQFYCDINKDNVINIIEKLWLCVKFMVIFWTGICQMHRQRKEIEKRVNRKL